MKKVLYFGVVPFIVLLAMLYGFMTYTHTGRIWGLYAFAAFKTPVAVKIDCIKDTNQRVHDKFLLPLDFTAEAKNALREYWHFSYYRHCLFEAGYDFYGNRIEPSSLTVTDGVTAYRNPFGHVRMTIPGEATMTVNNATDPNLDDFIIASTLLVGESEVQIHIDRSYKQTDTEVLQKEFAGFEAKTDFPSPDVHLVEENQNGTLLFVDGSHYGAVVLVPESHIVTIYAGLEDKDLIDTIAASVAVTP